MRRTEKEVNFYLDMLNTILKEKGLDYLFVMDKTCGYKTINKCVLKKNMHGDYYMVPVECIRGGLTTGDAYDIAYSMYKLADIL